VKIFIQPLYIKWLVGVTTITFSLSGTVKTLDPVLRHCLLHLALFLVLLDLLDLLELLDFPDQPDQPVI
jgi:hypothetical protein